MAVHRVVEGRSFDGPRDVALGERARRPPGPGEVRLRVRAAGVNAADLMTVSGTHQDNPPPPFVPGFEAAGEVAELGAGVRGLSAGDRVMTGADYGAFAEELVVDHRLCAPLPEGASFAEGAAMPVAFGTGYAGLVHRGGLGAGDWLLVMGGGGNIGGGARVRHHRLRRRTP